MFNITCHWGFVIVWWHYYGTRRLIQDSILSTEDRKMKDTVPALRGPYWIREGRKKCHRVIISFNLCCEGHLDILWPNNHHCPFCRRGFRSLSDKASCYSHQFLHFVHLTLSLDIQRNISCNYIMFFLEPLRMIGNGQSWHKIWNMNLGYLN